MKGAARLVPKSKNAARPKGGDIKMSSPAMPLTNTNPDMRAGKIKKMLMKK